MTTLGWVRRGAVLMGLAMPLGCVVVDPGRGETEGSSSGSHGSTSTTAMPLDTGATSVEPPSSFESTTSSTGPADTGDTSTTGEPPSFGCPRLDELQCDAVAQDCPAGFRCIPWTDPEYGALESTTCVPVNAEPVPRHGACTIDREACTDDCGFGDFCYPDGPSGTETGICLGTCGGDGDDATCQAAGDACATCGACETGVCLQGCDPFDPQCPATMPHCRFLAPNGFVCLPSAQEGGGVGEACVSELECDPSLWCVEAESLGPPCEGPSCCTELCDVVDGDPGCSNPAHVCISLFGPGQDAPDLAEHVGYCGLEP